ncbi:hypothetical protein BGZ57DRAFT_983694 [Hyaloscypha finlandica]|nr:hypothetical protein BGZ57DRAFT_983694 [Hyaloscypha finlandica]
MSHTDSDDLVLPTMTLMTRHLLTIYLHVKCHKPQAVSVLYQISLLEPLLLHDFDRLVNQELSICFTPFANDCLDTKSEARAKALHTISQRNCVSLAVNRVLGTEIWNQHPPTHAQPRGNRTPQYPQGNTRLHKHASAMCDWEEFQFVCGHNSSRLLSYCHFARTDPYHQCFGVKVFKHTWVQNVACQPCLDAMRVAATKRAARGGR